MDASRRDLYIECFHFLDEQRSAHWRAGQPKAVLAGQFWQLGIDQVDEIVLRYAETFRTNWSVEDRVDFAIDGGVPALIENL